MHSSSTFSIPVVVPRGTVFPCNGRRPRGRGGRVGRVWRTTVVNRMHSVNSYVAVQAGVCLRCPRPGSRPRVYGAAVALCRVVPVVAAGSDFGHVRYCNGHLRDGHLRNSTECGSLRLSRSARAAERPRSSAEAPQRGPPCRS